MTAEQISILVSVLIMFAAFWLTAREVEKGNKLKKRCEELAQHVDKLKGQMAVAKEFAEMADRSKRLFQSKYQQARDESENKASCDHDEYFRIGVHCHICGQTIPASHKGRTG